MISLNKSVPFTDELFDHLAVAVYRCDSEGFITFYNKQAAKIWGREPAADEKWDGAYKLYTLDGVPLPKEECAMAITIKQQRAFEDIEMMVEQPNGSRVIVQPHPSPLFDDDGTFVGAINTLIDITGNLEGESKQAMLAAIIETSDDAIISKNLEGIITSWNIAAEQMYGYKENEIVGRHISLIIPEDRIDEEELIINKIKRGEKVDHYVTYRRTKSGKEIPVSLTISPIKNSRGIVTGASKIVRDITRQKQAEDRVLRYAEHLEIINKLSQDISSILDVENILQKVTDATTKLTGAAYGAFFYHKFDENDNDMLLYTLSGAPREAFEKFASPRNTAVFHPTLAGEGIIRSDDITQDPRYGHNAPHFGMPKGHLPVKSYLAVPVIARDGQVFGGLFYGHPQPDRFTREHETLISGIVAHAVLALDNARMYEDIQRLNSKKDEFIGLASHELKTPVTSLSGYLQILERGMDEADRNKGFIKKALEQTKKLTSLISDLLDVSKIETGKLPLSFSHFDMVMLIREIVELMQYSSKTHRIVQEIDVSELKVWADRQRIEQVLINLLSNAIKYSPNANLVTISMKQKNRYVQVSVCDNGIGIGKDQQERIFSRFYRVDDLASHISGLGIGLYISKDIIVRHGGTLTVESEPGKGSEFSFKIPIDEENRTMPFSA